jgi:hypothetical protein
MSNYRIPSDYQNQTPRAVHRRPSSAYGTIHPGLAIPVHHRHLNVGDRIRGRVDVFTDPTVSRLDLMDMASTMASESQARALKDGANQPNFD